MEDDASPSPVAGRPEQEECMPAMAEDESDPAHWWGRYPNEFLRDAVAPVADALLHHDRGGRSPIRPDAYDCTVGGWSRREL
jgi:hypothetical protein